uniref:Uncharacterized protein n=1 Tax=Anopheles albimanus TaxID=7167 RepID=A0A182FXJ8_ANOAL
MFQNKIDYIRFCALCIFITNIKKSHFIQHALTFSTFGTCCAYAALSCSSCKAYIFVLLSKSSIKKLS